MKPPPVLTDGRLTVEVARGEDWCFETEIRSQAHLEHELRRLVTNNLRRIVQEHVADAPRGRHVPSDRRTIWTQRDVRKAVKRD